MMSGMRLVALPMSVVLAACSAGGTVASTPSVATATPPAIAATTPAQTAAPTPAPTPVTLSGRGQTASAEIRLPSARSAATFTHRGTSNFAVHVFRGERRELLVNEIGTYDGARPLLGTDPIRLNIEADGAWTVTIAAIAPGGTAAVTGRGDFVSQLFTPPGTGSYRFEHSGTTGNYAVFLHCADRRQLIQNEIGVFSGSKIIQFGQAPCFWEVVADGAWSIAAQ